MSTQLCIPPRRVARRVPATPLHVRPGWSVRQVLAQQIHHDSPHTPRERCRVARGESGRSYRLPSAGATTYRLGSSSDTPTTIPRCCRYPCTICLSNSVYRGVASTAILARPSAAEHTRCGWRGRAGMLARCLLHARFRRRNLQDRTYARTLFLRVGQWCLLSNITSLCALSPGVRACRESVLTTQSRTRGPAVRARASRRRQGHTRCPLLVSLPTRSAAAAAKGAAAAPPRFSRCFAGCTPSAPAGWRVHGTAPAYLARKAVI